MGKDKPVVCFYFFLGRDRASSLTSKLCVHARGDGDYRAPSLLFIRSRKRWSSPALRLLELKRVFGHHAALSVGERSMLCGTPARCGSATSQSACQSLEYTMCQELAPTCHLLNGIGLLMVRSENLATDSGEGDPLDRFTMKIGVRIFDALEWRNWQTHGTQNPAPFTGHVGSTPTSSTNKIQNLVSSNGRPRTLLPKGLVCVWRANFLARAVFVAVRT